MKGTAKMTFRQLSESGPLAENVLQSVGNIQCLKVFTKKRINRRFIYIKYELSLPKYNEIMIGGIPDI